MYNANLCFLHLYIPLQKSGAKKIPGIRIKILPALKYTNVYLELTKSLPIPFIKENDDFDLKK